jgi:hypothetical protein
MAPGVAVMVMLEPEIVTGLKEEELVKPKVVVPSKVTVVPGRRAERSRAEPLGTAMLERTMFVQEATAEGICE